MRGLGVVAALGMMAGTASASAGTVTVARDPAAIVRRTPAAEFRLLVSGELHGALLDGEKRLSVQEPGGPGDAVEIAGSPAGPMGLEFAGATVTEGHGALGTGERVEVRGRGANGLEMTLAVEVYDDFPSLAFSTVTCRNGGTRPLTLAKVVQQRHRLNALCPALPEVREHLRALTQRFVRDWGFDGHKLDVVFTVPPCHNPAHHHPSPEASIQAMGDAYETIFETTRALKPDSVTQICPCGTPPNVAWLPYMDQAVTADPIGARQVRTRIKMYKALLGPEAAVYGDHVELSEMKRAGGKGWLEVGRDFASTIGTGGIVGTKFTWPDYGPKLKAVFLDDQKEAHWKKWISLYNAKRLSEGTFRNLYVHGYDVPEGYAIAKDGRMHYAFFAPDPGAPRKGRLELRGLAPGRHAVRDYVDGADLGVLDAAQPFLNASFTHHFLLEVVPAP